MENTAIILVVTILFAVALFTIYPSIEGLLQDVGQEMATGANYTINPSEAENAKTMIWGVGGTLVVLALVVTAASGLKKT